MPTRRQVIKSICGAALCAGFGVLRPFYGLAGAAALRSEARPAMGTLVEITLAGLAEKEAVRAFDAAFARIGRVEKILTSHDNSAPLAELARRGSLQNPPPELVVVLKAALEHARLSGGAFNPAVKPRLDILRKNPKASQGELEAVRQLLDWRAVRVEQEAIYLDMPGMSLTLDAIAKGCIVDYASQELFAQGAPNHLINAGGDMLARGLKPDGSGWKAGIADPRPGGKLLAVVPLRDQAIATSNNSESLKEGYSHLVPPQGGEAAGALPLSASALALSAGTADALATTLAVMPAGRGLEYIESFGVAAGVAGDASCLLLSAGGDILKSRRWPKA